MNQPSIAILPFRNISNNQDNDFFCEGISEEIINALTKIEQLKVTSRTSSFYFKNRQFSIKEIGEKLNVGILLEGSVRVSFSMLRITAQLINVEEDTHFWSQTWDRKMENIFEIQDEVSLLIADKLREYVGHLEISEHLINKQTDNIDAYKHLLKARFHNNKWNAKDTNIAIEEFTKAIQIDKNLIEGYIGLADAYSFMAVAGFVSRETAWLKSKEMMAIAQKMDSQNADLNYMLANDAFFTNTDFKAAMDFALKGLATTPTHLNCQRFLSFLYMVRGDFKKAKDHLFYAKSIDPMSPETLFYEAHFYYRTINYNRSLAIMSDLLALNSNNLPAIICSIYVYIKQGKINDARDLLASVPQTLITPDEYLGLQCLMDVTENSTTYDLSVLIQHAKDSTAHHAHSYLFMVYAILGKSKEAFEVLNNLFEHNSSVLLLHFTDPLSENLKKTPKYKKLHQKIYAIKKTVQPTKKSKSKTLDSKTINHYVEKLNKYILDEEPFLNPALSLRLLANQINIHPNQLSWLLNEQLGKNFNEFINKCRIEHFKKLVLNPANSHISMIGLAYESGFNSKTVFNTTFKKTVGMTPKQYQKSQIQG